MRIKQDEFGCKMTRGWLVTRFLNVRINGIFRCDGAWWKKDSFSNARKIIGKMKDHQFSVLMNVPNDEKIITIFEFTKPM